MDIATALVRESTQALARLNASSDPREAWQEPIAEVAKTGTRGAACCNGVISSSSWHLGNTALFHPAVSLQDLLCTRQRKACPTSFAHEESSSSFYIDQDTDTHTRTSSSSSSSSSAMSIVALSSLGTEACTGSGVVAAIALLTVTREAVHS